MCSIFPDEWKYAEVCPIHKKDSTDDLNDYRPISVISAQAIVKLLERIINNHTIYAITLRLNYWVLFPVFCSSLLDATS